MAEKATDVVAGKTTTTDNEAQGAPNVASGLQQESEAKITSITMEDPSGLYCDAMSERDINRVADGTTINRVVLIGFEAYGKSTFASSMYYCFTINENFCGQMMYDSDTYSGFERRMLVRDAMRTDLSLKEKRTLKGDNPLLVMSLESEATGKYKLVLSDRSGEDYRQFAGSDEEIRDNQILKVAEHVVFFIDGEKMMANYADLRYDYNNLLEELTGKGLLPEKGQLKLVFNKHDIVKDKQDYATKKVKTEEMFKKALGDRVYKVYEMDATGASDSLVSVEKLVKDLLLKENTSGRAQRELLDWVNKELK